jgi:hypothetical protein
LEKGDTVSETKILVYLDGWIETYTPFNDVFRVAIKGFPGKKWDPGKKCWVVRVAYLDEVKEIITEIYGSEPEIVMVNTDRIPGGDTSGGYRKNYTGDQRKQKAKAKPKPPPNANGSANGSANGLSWVSSLYYALPEDQRKAMMRSLTKAFHPDVNPKGEDVMKEITRIFR